MGDGVNNGTTVYGKVSFTNEGSYAPDIVTLTSRLNDGDYSTHILRKGTKVPEPANLADASPALVFKGWNKADGTKWDFNTPITENTTITGELYAPVDNEADLLATLADSAVGLIRLTDDIVIGTNPTIDRKVTLDLNGHVLRYFNETRPFVSIKITGDLTIIDRSPAAEHRFKNLYEGDNLLVLDEAGGNRVVKGGIITNCGIYVDGGKFTMNGGSIVGSQGSTGAIEIFNGGTFNMNSGMILGCYSGGVGAVSAFGGSTFTMTGGVIKECSANAVDNGGIFLSNKAVMNANGGEVDGMVVVEDNSEITYKSKLTGVTSFLGDEIRVFHNSMISYGLYYGTITLGQTNCRIFGAVVTYMNGETEYAKQVSRYGGLAARPIDPVSKTGYTLNWYKSDGKAWNYEKDIVGRNITLTSKLDVNQYTITVKPENGEEDIVLTQDYGTAVTAPTLTKSGYAFKGWDKTFPTTMPAENITITAQWEVNRYTITFDTDGGSEIAPITEDYGTPITAPADPTRKGYTFIGWDREIPETMPSENITLKAKWKDTEKPTGEITIDKSKWRSFLNKLTFGLFFADTQTVEITAADNSGRVSIGYYVTDLDLSEADLRSTVFKEYEGSFNLEPNGKYIVYVMLTDESLNITYLRSDRVTLDNISPLITGIENGKTYCEAQTVTVTDESLDTVTVNGEEVTLDENGSFVLAPAKGEQKIVADDKAGNSFEMTVTVNDGHTPSADDGDCSTPVLCKLCSQTVVAAKNHNFSGEWLKDENRHWHRCLNENCTVTDTKTAHSGTDDGDCLTAVVCECGYILRAAESQHTFGEWTSNGDGTHTRSCTAKDCRAFETKNCSGGKATCTEKAECAVCSEKYGDLDPDNHSGKTEWVKTETEHTERYGCCGAVTVKTENHEWADGVCRECDYNCKHSGGKATCTEKAVCTVCGEKYGELDPDNHGELKHIEAKAATEEAEGNIEYWYCEDCGKYFGDKDGKTQITKAETVLEKLPKTAEPAKSEEPAAKTGDTANILLWMAVFFVSGGTLICTAVFKKRKKFIEK